MNIFVTLSIGIDCYRLSSILIDYHNAVFLSIVFPLSWPLLPFRVLLIHHGSSYHAPVSRLISIGNHMISSAIWDKSARVNFSKANQIARALRARAICSL